jgi:hypothetical protein
MNQIFMADNPPGRPLPNGRNFCGLCRASLAKFDGDHFATTRRGSRLAWQKNIDHFATTRRGSRLAWQNLIYLGTK